jgi:hypothetical protein
VGQEKQHGAVMSADVYRAKAVQFFTMARAETNPRLQVEYASIAESYFRLALQAEKNQKNDIAYEMPRRGQIPKP